MEEQYMADLSHYMNERSIFPSLQQGFLSTHYDLAMVGYQGFHQDQFHSNSTTSASVIIGGGGGGGGGGGTLSVPEMEGGSTERWRRQETLTLLEIRSRLDLKFKEANQKGPLWDDISRIMLEKYGYQRSGKKCREKFCNLYKYYKKTKEGKSGKQDGKHYRFFSQLEALYGETSNGVSPSEPHLTFHDNIVAPNPEPLQTSKHSDHSLSLSNSSDFDTSSSDESNLDVIMGNDLIGKRKKRSKRGWKAKIKDFIDLQMKKLMDKQEAWLENMIKTIERKEIERMLREEERRKQEEARIEMEHKLWAKERSRIEARDTALMEALQKFTGEEFRPSSSQDVNDNGLVRNTLNDHDHNWQEPEISRAIQLRTAMELKYDASNTHNSSTGLNINENSCFGHFIGEANNLWDNYN